MSSHCGIGKKIGKFSFSLFEGRETRNFSVAWLYWCIFRLIISLLRPDSRDQWLHYHIFRIYSRHWCRGFGGSFWAKKRLISMTRQTTNWVWLVAHRAQFPFVRKSWYKTFSATIWHGKRRSNRKFTLLLPFVYMSTWFRFDRVKQLIWYNQLEARIWRPRLLSRGRWTSECFSSRDSMYVVHVDSSIRAPRFVSIAFTNLFLRFFPQFSHHFIVNQHAPTQIVYRISNFDAFYTESAT